ncbi:hypothetical protein [Roseovarius sp. ZX-A-9]|uniref:hypothetical protein n=1 Tax=Roseovarius sp. ZX-A-9 TaxID=3014783 RepID=UPI00232DDCC3|nr:hypothetical protein [Roseovarius sp. ZX-A-9]
MTGHFRRFGIFLFALHLWGGAAVAQGCGCNPLPSEGTYGKTDPFTLTHLDGDESTCPTQIRLQAKRRGAPDIDVPLFCQPEKAAWIGVEPSPFGGPFIYELSAGEPPLDMASGEYVAQLAASRAMSEAATLKMFLPPMLVAMGKSDLNISLELTGKGRAAPCICGEVRLELDHVSKQKAAYEDKDLIAHARALGLRGSDSGQNFWMDSNRQLHQLPPREHRYSYDDLVSSETTPSSVALDSPDQIAAQGAKIAAKFKPSELQPGAFAQTHPISCAIKMMHPKEAAQSCVPAIVMKAAFEHEARHRALCRKFNSPPTYVAPDGTTVNWKERSGATGLYIDGISAPASGYYAWAQMPENHAADEAAAYGVEVKILQDWLSANCD